MLNDEWLKQKLWEREVKDWTLQFQKAEGNKQEWQEVYRRYLKSDVWREKRKQVLNRADGKCEGCGAFIPDPDVHHLNYKRVGGNERAEDLKVLCYPCHRDADKTRDKRTDERRKNSLYQSRLDGFASSRYGDDWCYVRDRFKVEIEFITCLYKKDCDEYGFDFDPHFDPETDIEFLEFWDMVLDGNC